MRVPSGDVVVSVLEFKTKLQVGDPNINFKISLGLGVLH